MRFTDEIGIAIERVLADVEIERRQVRGHEARERGEDALVVEIGVGLAHQRVELGQPVQHQPLQLRHLVELDAVVLVEMRQRAEHPAHGVAQLAIGIGRGLENLRPDAQIVGIVGGAHPHAQDIGAGLLDHVLRRGDVAGRLRHLAALLVEHEAVREHHVDRARGRACRSSSSSEEWNQPRCWSVPSRYITVSLPPSTLRLMPASCGKCTGSSSTKACVEPESNQTSQMSSTFFQPVVGELAEEALARAVLVPGVGALGLEGLDDAHVDFRVFENLDRAVGLFLDEHGDRHAPGALARDHPVGARLDHAGDAVFARRRAPSA